MDFAQQFLALNRGLVSPLALGRLDIKRMALAADVQTNWMTRVLGPMSLRPGMQYLGSTRSDAAPLQMDFVFDQDDTALIELTDTHLRVRVNDVIVARPAIGSTFFDWNGAAYVPSANTESLFDSAPDVALWRDNDESGGVSQYNGGFLQLVGDGTASAIRDRPVNVVGYTNIEHCLTIIVATGLLVLRVGYSEGGDDLIQDRTLRPGTHSIAFTPSTNFYIRLSASTVYATLVTSMVLERGGSDMVLPTPWTAANLNDVRWVQSGDVLFVACDGLRQMRIERQDRTNTPPSRSWSIVDYLANDGPFRKLNAGPVQLAGSALTGNIALAASSPFFKAGHVGSLFRLTSAGQQVARRIQAQNVFTNPIRVTGIGEARIFQLDLIGPTFTATTTATLQRSVAAPGTWADIASYTAPISVAINDNLDNQIIYYRVGVKTGAYTAADDITASLTFSAGSIDGIVRITGINNPGLAGAAVLQDLGSTAATQDWYEGDWSPKNGYPSAVEMYDGRMCWAGRGFEWLSIVDLLDSFDDTVPGDSGPIRRGIGSGPVDSVPWLMALNFLLLGTAGNILVAKSSSIDTPLTPTAFSLKPVAGIGAARVRAVPIDTNGIFISRNGSRVYQLSADANAYSIVPYAPAELTELFPDIGLKSLPDDVTALRSQLVTGGFVRVAVQRHPNTRIHLVRADGSVVIVVFDKAEQVTCMLEFETDGDVEDVQVLPGALTAPAEDQVYYSVKRTIGGATKRYVEKWALESQTVGAADNRQADAFVVKTSAGGPIFTGLSHLEGEDVVLWIDGVCPLDASNDPVLYRVTGGQITAPSGWDFACAGLPYGARWRNATLAAGSRMGAPLTELKNIDHVGLVMADTHALGLRYGQSFEEMDDLPMMEAGARVDPDSIWRHYNYPMTELDGTWDTDPRICLLARAPLPCTVLGLVVKGQGHDK